MIRIIKSGFSPLGRDRIIEEIRDHITNGARAFLIVPEQQTVMAEGLASRALPPDSVLSFEATNFTRLTNTAERTLGGLSGEYSDKAKKSLVMWRALTELSPLLTELSGRREVSFGLVERNLSAVLEMQSLGIHPEELSLAVENSKIKSDGRLSAKIKDLSLVYSLYKKLLSEKYSDTADDGEKLVKLLTDNPNYLSDTKIFIAIPIVSCLSTSKATINFVPTPSVPLTNTGSFMFNKDKSNIPPNAPIESTAPKTLVLAT